MENNNDPSTGSGTNKNKKVEELSDEQLKEVAGGRTFPACGSIFISSCVKIDKDCDCTKCAEGYVLQQQGNGNICVR